MVVVKIIMMKIIIWKKIFIKIEVLAEIIVNHGKIMFWKIFWMKNNLKNNHKLC